MRSKKIITFVLNVCAIMLSATGASAACNYIIAPNGSDSGAGTLASPWKTINYASSKLSAGQTLCARGGTYYGQSGYIWKSSGKAGAPVTFANYPGEAPVFDGQWGDGASEGDFLVLTNNSHVVIDGITVQHYVDQYGNGAIDLFNGNGPVDDILIQNVRMIDNGSHSSQDHHIYIAAGVTNITIRNSLFVRASGGAIHAYHTPAASGIKIYNNVIIGGKLNCSLSKTYPCSATATATWGIIMADALDVQVYNNTIIGEQRGIDFNYGTTTSGPYVVRNNIVMNSTEFGMRVATAYATNFSSDNNIFSGNRTDVVWKNSNMTLAQFASATANDRHSLNAVPTFVNSSINDFHLSSNSSAIDRGVSLALVATDKDGLSRRVGSTADIGAYEYQGSVLSPTPSPTPVPRDPASVAVTLSATSLNFTASAVGTASAVQTVTIKNTGTTAFTIPSAFVMTGDFAFGGVGTCTTSTSYAPGASCTASVVFKPTATGTRTGSLSIMTSASSTALVVKLNGSVQAPTPTPAPTPKPTPVPTAAVTLSATSLSFTASAVGATSAVQLVTVKNTGTAGFTISKAFVMTGDFAFGGVGTCTLASYAPGASCTASVVFKPTATGTRTGTLSIVTSASTTPLVVALAGAVASTSPTPTPAPTPSPTPKPTATPVPVAQLYVSPSGSDSNAGTQAAPYKTISKAASMAKAGTLVHVAPGTYGNVTSSVSGTASARIRFVSDTKWGAKIVGTGTEYHWNNNGSYVEINGFDISGSGRGGIVNMGSYTLMTNNHVHNLTVSGGCTGSGGAGIVNANYAGSDGDIIGNVVHDVGVPGSCNGVQGIYHSHLRGRIMNNISYRNASFGIHLWHAANEVTVMNNTVFANGSSSMGGGIVSGRGDTGAGVMINTRVANNVVYNNLRGGITQYCYSGESCIGSGNTTVNNVVYGNGSTNVSLKVGTATGTITADPQFVNYKADGTGDYHLKSTSPAIDKGSTTMAPSTDMDGRARPLGAGIDIGAYENY